MTMLWAILTQVAQACHSSCDVCSPATSSPWDCAYCAPGFFKQPEGTGLCFNYCPAGFTPVAGECSGTSAVIVDYVLDGIGQSAVDRQRGWTAVNGLTAAPALEAADSLPAKHRGSYFTGSSYLRLPPESASADPSPLLGTNFAILAWVYSDQSTSWQSIFSQNLPSATDEDSMNAVRLTLRNDMKVAVTLHSKTVLGSILSVGVWYCVAVTVKFDRSTASTTVGIYVNAVLDTGVSLVGVYPYGDAAAVTSIGMDYDYSSSGLVSTDFFHGFIWEVKVWNYCVDLAAIQSEYVAASTPLSAGFALWSCGLQQYDNAGVCSPCASLCVHGCTQAVDCYLCANPICTVCDSFESPATCAACKENAHINGSGGCDCDTRYYYESTTRTCKNCYGRCLTCSGPGSAQCTTCPPTAYISGGQCVCNAGYYYAFSAAVDCTACNPKDSLGRCQCPPGFHYSSVASPECSVCGSFCNPDSTGTWDACSQCYSSAQVNHDVQESCYCSGSTYLPMGGSACAACHITCVTCDNGTDGGCTACNADSVLHPGPTGTCKCISGYRPASSATCAPCYSLCVTCAGGTAQDCTACSPDSYLSLAVPTDTKGECRCTGSLYRPAPTAACTACYRTCEQCGGSGDSMCTRCFDDSYLDPSPTGKCICSGSSYRSTVDLQCYPCHSTCYRCVGGARTDCTQCYPDSQLSISPVGECVCSGSFFRPPSDGPCEACHVYCTTCVAGTEKDCTACLPDSTLNAISLAPPVGTCECSGSFYHAPNVGLCQPCDGSCATCSSGGAEGCTSCYSDSTLLPALDTSSGECRCNGQFYHPPNSRDCLQCYVECLRCRDESPLGCTHCYPSAHLNGLEPARCVCDYGYAGGPNTSQCRECHETCLDCLGLREDHCIECRENLYLTPAPVGRCLPCPETFFFNSITSTCEACGTGCSTCVSSFFCVTCLSPLRLQPNYTCQEVCSPPRDCLTHPSTKTCFAAYIEVLDDNSLSLRFAANLSQALLSTSVSLTFRFEPNDIAALPFSLVEVTPHSEYSIAVSYDREVPANSSVTLSLLNPADITSEDCRGLATSELTSSLNRERKSNSDDFFYWEAIIKGVTLALIVNSLLGGSATLLWLFINTFQLISFIPLSLIPLTKTTRRYLTASNVLEYLYNPTNLLKLAITPVPQYALNCNYDTVSFISNIGEVVMSFFGVLCSFLSLSLAILVGSRALKRWAKKKRKGFRWNVLIRLALESYLPVLVAAGLQVYYVDGSTFYNFSACILALVHAVRKV